MTRAPQEPASPARRWTVVIPVRDPQKGKTRLGMPPSIVVAIATDTVAAAVAAELVSRILVVTDALAWTAHLGVRSMLQTSPGLSGAINDALEATPRGPVAILLGDVASLRPEDLDEALEAARRVCRGYVADHTGNGTVLITARRKALHRPRFGADSAAAHAGQGYQRLPERTASTLRLDYDDRVDLAHGMSIGTGPALRAALATCTALAAGPLVTSISSPTASTPLTHERISAMRHDLVLGESEVVDLAVCVSSGPARCCLCW